MKKNFYLSFILAFFFAAVLNAQIKVGYVTSFTGITADGASDPIVAMLEADANVDLTVIEADADDTVAMDLTMYDVVVGQEAFGSKSNIYKQGATLGMGTIPVPFILNKVYTMRDTRGFSGGVSGSGGEVEGTLYLEIEAANQSNDLFKGIALDGDSVKLFYTGGDDSGGDTRTKGLQYAVDVEISTAGTKLAGGVNDPENATVCINDIPAGDSIGSEKLQARMITMAMNYGAICKDGGNLTPAGLTIWRNAIYSLGGMAVPAEALPKTKPADFDIAFVIVDDRDAQNYEFLMNQGFNVHLIQPANAAISTWTGDTLSWVENADLAILGRSMNSSSQQDSIDNAMWSMVDVPVMQISPWSSRSSRNHMFNSTSTSNLSGSLTADIHMPADGIFDNVTVPADNKMEWFGVASDILTDASGTSNGEWVVAVGDSIPLVVRFEANKAYYEDGPDSAVAERVYFGMGQEPGGANYFPLTKDGKQIYLNEVCRILGIDPPAAEYSTVDYNIAFVVVDDRDLQNYDFLEQNGFNVNVIQPANAAISTWTGDTLSWVENSDLVILGRSMNSSSQQDSIDNAMWSMVDVPVIQISPWSSRSSRNHMFNSTSTSNLSGALKADILMPDDAIFNNVTVTGDTMTWFTAASDILTDASGTSQGEWVVAVGDSIPLVVRFEANKAFYVDGPDSAVAERVYFGMGQEPGGVNYFPLSDDGKQVYLNEVCRILNVEAPEAVIPTYANLPEDIDITFVVVDDRDFYNYAFIEANGFNVTVLQPSDAAVSTWTADTLAVAQDADLVILGRSMNSSSQQNAADLEIWDNMDVPIIQLSPWSSRNSRNNMFNSAGTSNLADPTLVADISNPDDAIFGNVTLEVDNTLTWFNELSDILTDASGTSNGEWVVAVGDSIPLVVRFAPNVPFYAAGPDTAVADRVYFGMGSEPGGVNYFPLTDEAKQVYLNEICRLTGVDFFDAQMPALSDDATLSDLAVDGVTVEGFSPDKLIYDLPELPGGTTSVEITATANQIGAEVTGTGTIDLSSGVGTATITVTAEDKATVLTYKVNLLVSGIENPEAEIGVNVYPNPATNNMFVQCATNIASAQIFSTNGQLVKVIDNINAMTTTIDVSEFNDGLYNLRVVSVDNRVTNTMFIKK